MKRIFVQFLGISLLLLVLSACGSSKKGCGLTSDALKIERERQKAQRAQKALQQLRKPKSNTVKPIQPIKPR